MVSLLQHVLATLLLPTCLSFTLLCSAVAGHIGCSTIRCYTTLDTTQQPVPRSSLPPTWLPIHHPAFPVAALAA